MAIDSHKHYAMVGGMNRQKKWTLRPRKVQMPRFRAWAANNLRPGDAIVLETTANVWDIYDIVAPLVSKTVLAIQDTASKVLGAIIYSHLANCLVLQTGNDLLSDLFNLSYVFGCFYHR